MKINYRHNVMNITSITAFAQMKGGYNGGCRDVYFIRLLGGNESLKNEVINTDNILTQEMILNKLFYKRIAKLPMHLQDNESSYYIQCYDNWLASDKKKMIIHSTESNEEFALTLGNAVVMICDKYAQVKKGMSASIQKNFVIKIIWWVDFIFHNWHMRWNERVCIKIIAENVSKVQEYLFYYLLTWVGADVLMLQSKEDIDICDELKKLSKESIAGNFVKWDLPEFHYCDHKNNSEYKKHEYEKKNNNFKSQVITNKENVENKNIKSEKIIVHIPQRKRQNEHSNFSANTIHSTQTSQPNPVPVHMASNTINSAKKRTEKSFEELALLASSIVMIEVHNQLGDIEGIGSGIMVGKEGYILTNHHVVNKGWYYCVRIENDEEVYRTNEVIKYNSVMDLAVIRIAKTLSPLPIYKGPNKLVRGQKVVAIGSPLGLFNSVSDGIISGFRVMDNVDVIQFTAPISHGSSGGALLNMYGEVIGISSAGIDSGQNLNLAVPYDCINLFIRGFC